MIPTVDRTGWIPYSLRTKKQRQMTDKFHERVGFFGQRGMNVGDVPEKAILHELEIRATGSLLPRIWQQTGSCLPPNALVRMSDGTEKQICEVLAGDWVISHTGTSRMVVGTQCKQTTEQMREITAAGFGDRLRCTDNHVVPTWDGSEITWKKACEVVVGDRMLVGVLSENADTVQVSRTVVSNEAVGVPEYDVWDIEVEHDHTFIANGFVVHNCVGAGGARAYTLAQVGDVINRGDQEAIKIPFPYATYGVGREISGARGTGEGSFGGAQAEAIRTFGMVPFDFENGAIPRPTIKDGWATWKSAEEIKWSHPSAWPVKRSTLEPDAQKFLIQDVTQVGSVDELVQGLAQGFSGTMACMFGTKPRVEKDVLLGRWNDQWAHQQCVAGYWQHPSLGLLFIIDNQWNDVHGHCPTLYELGVTGSYWILESDMKKIIKSQDGEVYLHSNTKGFPLQTIDWGTMGI